MYHAIAGFNKDPSNHGVPLVASALEQNNSTGNFFLSTAKRPPAG